MNDSFKSKIFFYMRSLGVTSATLVTPQGIVQIRYHEGHNSCWIKIGNDPAEIIFPVAVANVCGKCGGINISMGTTELDNHTQMADYVCKDCNAKGVIFTDFVTYFNHVSK